MTTDAFVIGGGPAGLMAAEQLLAAGHTVCLFDSQRSVGRKFLLAGIGGLNLTHSEPRPAFDARYGDRQDWVAQWLDALDGSGLRAWADRHGAQTFIGSSGRVFPQEKKAAPLLRAWLSDLRGRGLQIRTQHRLLGLSDTALHFSTPDGDLRIARPTVVILALGGGSWPQLGSDGAWSAWFDRDTSAPLAPSNCGMECQWSPHLRKLAGAPIKPMVLQWTDQQGVAQRRQGECVLTHYGLEGSALYPAVPDLRAQLQRAGKASVWLDLLPHTSPEKLQQEIRRRGDLSNSEWAKRRLKLSGVRLALFNEHCRNLPLSDASAAATQIKRIPVDFTGIRPLAEAISTAGGIRQSAVTPGLMIKQNAGVFCAGEMLDWEAPTGGYLLTACFASGVVAGRAAAEYLRGEHRKPQ